MKPTVESFWKFLNTQGHILSNNDDVLRLRAEKKDEYIRACTETYNRCKEEYMSSDVDSLDRHKVAAILVVEGIKNDIVECKSNKAVSCEEIVIGPEKLLLIGAINYLANQMEDCLEGKALPMRVFKFPTPFSCETPYIDVASRLLHYASTEDWLSVLDLADRLFLLEYISISLYYQERAGQIYDTLRETGSGSLMAQK